MDRPDSPSLVLVEIVVITVLGLWSGSSTGHIFAIVGIVANVAILGIDLVYRRPQKPQAQTLGKS